MSIGDKLSNRAEVVGGKAKEAGGKATGNETTENEGKTDQAKAGFKDASEDLKGGVSNAAHKAKDAFKKN